MKAILCNKWGDPEVLELKEISNPQPNENEILIKIKAVAVNYADLVMLKGQYQTKPEFPFGPGLECAGEIVSLGKNVTQFMINQRVLAKIPHSGFAEYTLANPEFVYEIPNNMSWEHAASFFVAYVSSYTAIKYQGDLKPGQKLLVLGASGGTGLTAVEIGKAIGAQVYAAASSQAKIDIIENYNPDYTINYKDKNLKEEIKNLTDNKGVDVVFDPVGGEFFDQALSSLDWGGKYLIFGFVGGIPQIPSNRLLVKHRSAIGCSLRFYENHDKEKIHSSVKKLFEWYDSGLIKPFISEQFELKDAQKALNILKSRKATGRIIISV
tara:strand:+ start:1594 stop:2565 length:972 start_codon:yes stop_codon:yes gene_type:complete